MREFDRPLLLFVFSNSKESYLREIYNEMDVLEGIVRPAAEKLRLSCLFVPYSKSRDIINLINQNKNQLLIFHFAGHSNDELIQLDEGSLHSEGLSKALASCPNLELTFLNGCSNAGQARLFVREGVKAVIGTKAPISDQLASDFSHQFYKGFVGQYLSVYESFRQAKTDIKALHVNRIMRSLHEDDLDGFSNWDIFLDRIDNSWKLLNAANPCEQLPCLKSEQVKILPVNPFKYLSPYTEKDSAIYFGRCQEILDVLNYIKKTGGGITVIHGESGVGKTSFLRAGVKARLIAAGYKVDYFRYDSSTFCDYHSLSEGASLSKHLRKQLQSKVLIFDQLESGIEAKDAGLEGFMSALSNIVNSEEHLGFHIIFSLRTEWYGRFNYQIKEKYYLPKKEVILSNLDKKAIIEIIESPFKSKDIAREYRLILDNSKGRLAEKIANDMLDDQISVITPTLQIILSELYEEKSNDFVIFSNELYLTKKKNGFLLENYLDRQIKRVCEKELWGEDAKKNGLILDILYTYTDEINLATFIKIDIILAQYSHIPFFNEILSSLEKNRLLAKHIANEKDVKISGHRLIHDAIAQIVRSRYHSSDLVSQQAQRILNNKLGSSILDSNEYKIVKKGIPFIGNIDYRSRSILRKSKLKRLRGIGFSSIITASILLFISLSISVWPHIERIIYKTPILSDSERSEELYLSGKINQIKYSIQEIILTNCSVKKNECFLNLKEKHDKVSKNIEEILNENLTSTDDHLDDSIKRVEKISTCIKRKIKQQNNCLNQCI